MHNQNGAVWTHYKVSVSVLVKIFTVKKFKLLVEFIVTLRTTAFSNIVLFNKHPKYLTLECCFDLYIPISYVKFLNIFLFKFRSKNYWFFYVLIKLSLLSTNKSHILEKSSFKCFWEILFPKVTKKDLLER